MPALVAGLVTLLSALPAAALQDEPDGVEQAAALLERVPRLIAERDPVPLRETLEQALVVLEGRRDDAALSLLADIARLGAEYGMLGAAREALTRLDAIVTAALPADDPRVIELRWQLAFVTHDQGDYRASVALKQQVLAWRELHLEEGDPELQWARLNLADSLRPLGELERARVLEEQALAQLVARFGEGHRLVQQPRLNLAGTLHAMGDDAAAAELLTTVLGHLEGQVEPTDLLRLDALNNLGAARWHLGDHAAARALLEQVVAICEQVLPPGHPRLASARYRLAMVVRLLGDPAASRSLLEKALAEYARAGTEDRTTGLALKQHYGLLLLSQFEYDRAVPILEEVVAGHLLQKVPDHPDVLAARLQLAEAVHARGDWERARSMFEEILRTYERVLPAGHLQLLYARQSYGRSLSIEGAFEQAREQLLPIRAWEDAYLPADHPAHLLSLRLLLLQARHLGDEAAEERLAGELIEALSQRVRSTLTMAPRQARAVLAARLIQSSLTTLLSRDDPGQAEALFGIVETIRAVASVGTPIVADDPHTTDLRAEALRLRQELNDLVAAGASSDDARPLSERVADLGRLRDLVEGTLRSRLADVGGITAEVERAALAATLRPGQAFVGYRGYTHWELDPGSPRGRRTEARLLAHVVGAAGQLARVELGPRAAIEQAVGAWRQAVQRGARRPASGGRGVRVSSASGSDASEPGARLRGLVLDPVLAAAGDVDSLIVCADGALHLVSLAALPAAGTAGAFVGDELAIGHEVAATRRLVPRAPPSGPPTLLTVGGIDFDAAGSSAPGVAGATAHAPPLRGRTLAGGFGDLPGTAEEAAAVAALFEQRFERPASVLQGAAATKAAVVERLPGQRYLHVATHGYFAGDDAIAWGDAPDLGQFGPRAETGDVITGLAPLTLCGLALTGANRGADDTGRVSGILTGEEISGLDLSGCELVVLSACETNVGVRRQGQDLLSLRAALHAAGARTAITSLWQVDDQATRRLMTSFYRRLWLDGLPPARALREAQRELRLRGAPLVDWAGWVLSGDPD